MSDLLFTHIVLIMFVFLVSGHLLVEEALRKFPSDTLLYFGNNYIENLKPDVPRVLTNKSMDLKLNNKEIISIVFLENIEMLETFSEYLQDNMYSKVLILKSTNIANEEIFEKCFEKGLLNVVLIDSTNSITTYLPFSDDLKIHEVDPSNIFNNDFLNLHGFKITFGGTLFNYMFSFANAQTVLIHVIDVLEKKFNIKIVTAQQKDPDILLGLHYKDEQIQAGKISNFYEFENLDVMIPVKSTMNRYLYLVQPFNWKVWIVISLGVIYHSTLLKILVKGLDFPSSFLECLQLTLWQSAKIPRTHWLVSSVYIILMIEGFILVNLYSMYLGSFLVVDIKEQDFEIAIVANAEVVRNEFNKVENIRFKHMGAFDYGFNLLQMNMEFGYAVNKMLWETNSIVRENFRKIKWEIRKPLPIMAVMRKDFRLEHIINHFLLMEYSHGVYKKWLRDFITLRQVEDAETKSSVYLVFSDFRVVTNLFYIGMGLATIIFIMEVAAGFFKINLF